MAPLDSIEAIQSRIKSLAQEALEMAGMDLIELRIVGNKKDVNIQITADKPSGGITIGECAILNRTLAAAIEQENLLSPEHFSLEVSSPGLDRPLLTRKDFLRFVSHELCVWLNGPIGGKKQVQGVLLEVGDSDITVAASGNAKLVIPLSLVAKGVLVI
jgi:ribosome maturation factor RimP